MKKVVQLICLVLCFALLFCSTAYAENISSADRILLRSGMSQEEIDALDPDIKEYIASTLPETCVYAGGIEVENAEGAGQVSTRQLDNTTMAFSAPCYIDTATGYYKIYPTYESTVPIRPRGNDSFAFSLGAGMAVVPNSLTGTVWTKDTTSSATWQTDWVDVEPYSLETILGYSIKGAVLGTPSWSMYFKGCCSFTARVHSADAARMIQLGYCYDTTGNWNYSVSLNVAFVGFGAGLPRPGTVSEFGDAIDLEP